jgi:tetratricopeptide (TPR) repeat protein
MTRMKILMIVGLLLMAGAAPAKRPGKAEGSAGAQATALLHSGMAHRRAGEYPEAIADFARGYELSGQPNFLFLLGEVQREAGMTREAIASYRRYLELLPDAPDRQLVLDQIEGLQQEPRVPRPVMKVPVQPKAGGGQGTLAPRFQEELPAPPGALARPAAGPEPRVPLYRRPILWIAIGAAAAGGLALGLGLGLGLRETQPTFVVAPGAVP